jgi:hypothetical protein
MTRTTKPKPQPERLAELGKVWRVYDELIGTDLLEDRREYSIEDFQKMYDLSEEQAYYLNQLIQQQFDPSYKNLYGFIGCMVPSTYQDDDHNRRDAVTECLLESMHQYYDGYEDGEKVLIQLYLNDLAIAANSTYQDRKAREDDK